MDKMISNLADLPLDLLEDLHLWYWNLVVKMISNFADLPLDLLTEQSLPVLTSCGQDDFKFCRCNSRSGFRSTPWYLHLVVKMSSNLADLPLDLLEDALSPALTSCGQDDFKFGRSTTLVLTSDSQDEFKYGRSTPRSAGRCTLPALKSCGQDYFKFGRSTPRFADRTIPPSTDISWSRWVQIWQIYP